MTFERPTGTGVGAGAGGLKGQQERNLDNLMKIFSKKEATQALTEMAKVKASTWTDIKDTVSDLRDLTLAGGVGNMIENIKGNVDLTIADALSPLANDVNQLIADWMTDNITPILTGIVGNLSDFVTDNSAGSLIGGIIGEVATLFLPGGELMVTLLALIGAVIEAVVKETQDPLGWVSFVEDQLERFRASARKQDEILANQIQGRLQLILPSPVIPGSGIFILPDGTITVIEEDLMF